MPWNVRTLLLGKPQSKLRDMSSNVLNAAKNLPLPERLALLDALWESIIEEGYDPPVTSAQLEEIDQRLRAHERSPEDVIDWKTIKAELDSKFERS